MKSVEELRKTLSKHKKKLRQEYKVKKIGIFGSYVRGEQKEQSDIDVLVEFSEPIGWEIIDLNEYLEKVLGVKVDLATVPAVRPDMRDSILNEVVYA